MAICVPKIEERRNLRYKTSFEEAVEMFARVGFTVLSKKEEYRGKNFNLLYVCEKHPDRIAKLSVTEFEKGKRCFLCRREKMKFSYEFVKEYFESQGCLLLSEVYVNTDSLLKYKCSCGNEDEITFYRFKNLGRRCRECSIKKLNHSGIKRHYEEIRQYIEDQGYLLLTEKEDYKNVNTKIKLMCDEGHEYEATYKNFKQHNRRCPLCKSSKGERLIEDLLSESGINYDTQYEFNGLVGVAGYPLRFDFAILNEDSELVLLIEYDGDFHFKEIYKGDSYQRSQIHDKRKNDYCISNEIPLLRIPIWEKDNTENILYNALLSNNFNNLDDYEYEFPFEFLVNHPEWSEEEYKSNYK
jgi:hypothetical protein